jgi:hypothetical protein
MDAMNRRGFLTGAAKWLAGTAALAVVGLPRFKKAEEPVKELAHEPAAERVTEISCGFEPKMVLFYAFDKDGLTVNHCERLTDIPYGAIKTITTDDGYKIAWVPDPSVMEVKAVYYTSQPSGSA